MTAALVVAPVVMAAAVLVVSGIAKMMRPDDEQGWQELGIPAPLRRSWIIRLHPVGEIVLAVLMLVVGGVVGSAASVAATALFLAYLVVVWRAHRRTPDASCACFGSRQKITVRTIVRNAWLVLLGAAAVWCSLQLPVMGGVLVVAAEHPDVLIVIVVVAVTR